jgi:hypothetical protein
MTDPLYRIAEMLLNVPMYLVAFVGMGLALRLRRTHPRACWLTVAATATLLVYWGVGFLFWENYDAVTEWAAARGLGSRMVRFNFLVVQSVLQTCSAALLLAAILTGRRAEP